MALSLAALVLLVITLVGAEIALVSLADLSAHQFPEVAQLRTPVLVLAIFFLISAQAALVVVGALVIHVRSRRILSRSGVRWVDILICLLIVGTSLLVVIGVVLEAGNAGQGGIMLGLAIGVLLLAALGGVVLVLRSLLRGSITLRDELDEVV